MECKSFKAEILESSRVLILGSMPGVKSLEEAQYYAHPQNRFWKVAGFLCNEDRMGGFCYSKKVQTFLKCGFALWDVIGLCKREGSLDSAITDEVPNDIRGLLRTYKNIKVICLNGGKAYSAFKKYFPDIIEDKGYKIYKMPSTSPANARFRLEDLINEWKKALDGV